MVMLYRTTQYSFGRNNVIPPEASFLKFIQNNLIMKDLSRVIIVKQAHFT
jgi:hypothetical protein